MSVVAIDLHGIKHEDVRRILIEHIEAKWQEGPDFIIVTGHSSEMVRIVRSVADEYKLHVEDGLHGAYQYLRFGQLKQWQPFKALFNFESH